jgi:thioredoxin reductase (NADPH)
MDKEWDVIIVGGGIAGLSAAIYLGRALRKTLIIDAEKSMANWEPHVENYLGFPQGIDGRELIQRGKDQAQQYGCILLNAEVVHIKQNERNFCVQIKNKDFLAKRLLLATGIYHIPPDLEGVTQCLGKSMFFCKDCDGYRVRNKRILIYGRNNEAAVYALSMLSYSKEIGLATDGKPLISDSDYRAWLQEYQIPIYAQKISKLVREDCFVRSIIFENGEMIDFDALFITRGDKCINQLALEIGIELDSEGQIIVDHLMRTTVKGIYAAGCITPSNCQMIIAAGQGALAAQSINKDLFEESLYNHSFHGDVASK